MNSKGFNSYLVSLTYLNSIMFAFPPQFPLFVNTCCTIALIRLKVNKI